MRPVIVVEKILETADRLFYTQGYNLTGINQIIAESDVARPSLYAHFASKHDLLLAYLDGLDKKWFEGLETFIGGIDDPAEKLLGIFGYRIDRQIRSDFGGCAWTKISHEVPKDDVEVFERVSKFKARLKDRIMELVKGLGRNGGDNQFMSDEMLGESIFLLIDGAQVSTCITKTPEALYEARKIAERLL
jgi:AcrR family transcriptional regulator